MAQITVNLHSSVCISGTKKLYIDPFRISGTPRDADAVLITHDHFDHYSLEDIAKVTGSDTVLVAPMSMANKLRELPEGKTFLSPGSSTAVCGLPIEGVAAYNIGKQFHPQANGWLGYVITLDGHRIYVAGDTDNTPEVRAVRCDVALLPVGGTYTMTAAEAAEAANAIHPQVAIPIHYGSIAGDRSCGEAFAKLVDRDIRVQLLL